MSASGGSRLHWQLAAAGIAGATLWILSVPGCGRPADADRPLEDPSSLTDSDPIPVTGNAAFANLCPHGTLSSPQPAPLQLWDCPLGLDRLELAQPPQALILSADCAKKILTIRSTDRRIDTAWEVLPNGYFDLDIPVAPIQLRNDGAQTRDCWAHTRLNIYGKLKCQDRDRVDIEVRTIWWIGPSGQPSPIPSASPSATPSAQPSVLPPVTPSPAPSGAPSPGPSPSPSPAPTPTRAPMPTVSATPSPAPVIVPLPGAACKLPTGCYLYAETLMKQCQ